MKFHPTLNLIMIRTKIYVDTALQMEMPGTSKTVRAETTASGLLVPAKPINSYTQQIQDKEYEFAEVVEIGPGNYQNGMLIKPNVKPGDIIAYLKLTGRTWIYDEGDYKYFTMNMYDVMGIIEDVVL